MTAAMAMSSFTRAFSTRRSPKFKQDANLHHESLYLGRAASQRNGRPVLRTLISSPVTLISTSNLQVHDAQTIAGTAPIEIQNVTSASPPASPTATSSRNSFEEGSECFWSAAEETDTSSLDGMSPATSESERSESDDYFPEEITPKIPQRAASHSKKAHEGLHRKRSFQRMSVERQQRSSTEIFAQAPSSSPFVEAPSRFESSPFCAELAQLEEVAEEFGQVLRGAELEAEKSFMQTRDLACLAASDYILDIHSLLLDLMQEDESSFEDFGGFF